MELRHLRYFTVLAEELHFSHAGERLGIEQSPLSRQIRDLETELKVRLLERTRRSTRLPPAGERFLIDARRILNDVDLSVRGLRAFSSGGPTLRMGLAEGLAGEAMGRPRRLAKCPRKLSVSTLPARVLAAKYRLPRRVRPRVGSR
ncbi:LysR family transcriptional regulator [Phenylobacterium sp.]|uniref:LysR family transcriptional regulator n=1 Tax=Phenylobacterium sp. TaxID=1871053 RepID=UPI003FA68EFF